MLVLKAALLLTVLSYAMAANPYPRPFNRHTYEAVLDEYGNTAPRGRENSAAATRHGNNAALMWYEEDTAATGRENNAGCESNTAAARYENNAAATRYDSNAAAARYENNAAVMGYKSNTAAARYENNAAAAGYESNAAAARYENNAAATGYESNAAAARHENNAAATGYESNAATGSNAASMNGNNVAPATLDKYAGLMALLGKLERDRVATVQHENHYDNYYDGDLEVNCENDEALTRVESRFSGWHKDRRWRWTCSQVFSAGLSENPECNEYKYYNEKNWELSFRCPKNQYLAGVESYHDPEDRIWSFTCCRVDDWCAYDCMLTDYINEYEGDMDHSGDGALFVGAFSMYYWWEDDRRWKIEQCQFAYSGNPGSCSPS